MHIKMIGKGLFANKSSSCVLKKLMMRSSYWPSLFFPKFYKEIDDQRRVWKVAQNYLEIGDGQNAGRGQFGLKKNVAYFGFGLGVNRRINIKASRAIKMKTIL